MTRARPNELEFAPELMGELMERVADIRGLGTGWVNFRPVIDREDEPSPPGPLAIFGGSPHKVPTATIIPGPRASNGTVGPTMVGLQHGSGPRVVARLRDLGLGLPEGWRVTQDHPRRGLVAQLPTECSDEEAIGWLVAAGIAVCAVRTTGRWRASFYAGGA